MRLHGHHRVGFAVEGPLHDVVQRVVPIDLQLLRLLLWKGLLMLLVVANGEHFMLLFGHLGVILEPLLSLVLVDCPFGVVGGKYALGHQTDFILLRVEALRSVG